MTEEPSGVEALRHAGFTVDQLAAVAGLDAARTTAELAGRRSLSDATMDALRGLLSPHAAEKMRPAGDPVRRIWSNYGPDRCDAVALRVGRHSVEQQEIPGLQSEEC